MKKGEAALTVTIVPDSGTGELVGISGTLKIDNDKGAHSYVLTYGRRGEPQPEVIAIEGTEAYVWTPNGVKAMTLSSAYLEKRFGSAATARNWSTLGKIVARF